MSILFCMALPLESILNLQDPIGGNKLKDFIPFFQRTYDLSSQFLKHKFKLNGIPMEKNDKDHTLQTMGIIPSITYREGGNFIVQMTAAILHDTGYSKFTEGMWGDYYTDQTKRDELRSYHEKNSIVIAKNVLNRINFNSYLLHKNYSPKNAENVMQEVLACIDGHDSAKDRPELDQKIMRDADRLSRLTGSTISRDLSLFNDSLIGRIEKFQSYYDSLNSGFLQTFSSKDHYDRLFKSFLEYSESIEFSKDDFNSTEWDKKSKEILDYNWLRNQFRRNKWSNKLDWELYQNNISNFKEEPEYIMLVGGEEYLNKMQKFVEDILIHEGIDDSVIKIKSFTDMNKSKQYTKIHTPLISNDKFIDGDDTSNKTTLSYAIESHKYKVNDLLSSINKTIFSLKNLLTKVEKDKNSTLEKDYEPEAKKMLHSQFLTFLEHYNKTNLILDLGGVSNKTVYVPGSNDSGIIMKLCKNQEIAKLHTVGWRHIESHFKKINRKSPYLNTGDVYIENLVIPEKKSLIRYDSVLHSIGRSKKGDGGYIKISSEVKDTLIKGLINVFHKDISELHKIDLCKLFNKEGIKQTKMDYKSKLEESIDFIADKTPTSTDIKGEVWNIVTDIGDFLNSYADTPCWDTWPENLCFDATHFLKSLKNNKVLNKEEYIRHMEELTYDTYQNKMIFDDILEKKFRNPTIKSIRPLSNAFKSSKKIFDPDKLIIKGIPNDSFVQLRTYRMHKYIDFPESDWMSDFDYSKKTQNIPDIDKKSLIHFGVFYYATRRFFYENQKEERGEINNTSIHSRLYYANIAKKSLNDSKKLQLLDPVGVDNVLEVFKNYKTQLEYELNNSK